MQAPNFETLYNIDDTILSCSAAAARNNGFASVYEERDIEKAVSPYVALTIQSGNPFHEWYLENTGSAYDAWHYTMEATIVTNRYNNNYSHSIYRNRAIDTLADVRTYDNLPYYFVENMRIGTVSKGMSAEKDLDMSSVRIEFDVWIRPNAWPS